MTRPLHRNCQLEQVGEVDRKAGEVWEADAFMLTRKGENLSSYERNRLYLNVNGETFVDASFASQVDLDSDSRQAITCDFDRNGTVDLLVGSSGGGPLRMFLNAFQHQNHRVALELVGIESNAQAIGSRVVVHVGGQQIVRDLFSANGFIGSGPPEELIGLGAAARIDRLEIRWPNGDRQEFKDLPVDVRIRLTEGRDEVRIKPLASVNDDPS